MVLSVSPRPPMRFQNSPRRANDSRLSLTGSSNGNGDTGGKNGRRGVKVRGRGGGGVCVCGGWGDGGTGK